MAHRPRHHWRCLCAHTAWPCSRLRALAFRAFGSSRRPRGPGARAPARGCLLRAGERAERGADITASRATPASASSACAV
eukprot:13224780-Alexandrium_andersonii.AAC.1